jgi:hypothetical protein
LKPEGMREVQPTLKAATARRKVKRFIVRTEIK